MKRHRSKPTDRAGYALVLFVMIFFGLMGLAALVIDMGFARLAQRQMQTAVDSAALEGLRFRRDCPDEWRTIRRMAALPRRDFDDAVQCIKPDVAKWLAWLDGARRTAASQMAANTFDDDLNPANGDPRNYGAGPVVQFQGGNSTLPTASQQLIVPASPVYKPTRSDGSPGLELNSGNAQSGDMVAGTYGANARLRSGDAGRRGCPV